MKALKRILQSADDLLLEAAAEGNIDKIQDALNKGANVNIPARRNPLNLAVGHSQLEAVIYLLQAGASPDYAEIIYNNCYDYDALTIAIVQSNPENSLAIIENLINYGAPLNRLYRGGGALEIAITHRKVTIANYLVEKGAEITSNSLLSAACYDVELFTSLLVQTHPDNLYVYSSVKPTYNSILEDLIFRNQSANPIFEQCITKILELRTFDNTRELYSSILIRILNMDNFRDQPNQADTNERQQYYIFLQNIVSKIGKHLTQKELDNLLFTTATEKYPTNQVSALLDLGADPYVKSDYSFDCKAEYLGKTVMEISEPKIRKIILTYMEDQGRKTPSAPPKEEEHLPVAEAEFTDDIQIIETQNVQIIPSANEYTEEVKEEIINETSIPAEPRNEHKSIETTMTALQENLRKQEEINNMLAKLQQELAGLQSEQNKLLQSLQMQLSTNAHISEAPVQAMNEETNLQQEPASSTELYMEARREEHNISPILNNSIFSNNHNIDEDRKPSATEEILFNNK